MTVEAPTIDLLSCVRLDTRMMVWVMSPQMLTQTERLRGLVTAIEGEKLAVLWNDGSESWAYRENLLEARLG
jgi:hypothetical protein